MSAAVDTFNRKAPTYMEALMRDFDFDPLDAAAVMGNAGHESGGLTIMQEIRPRGGRGGLGWFQWTGPRRRAYEAFSKDARLDPSSDDANYGFLVSELKGSERAAIDKTKAARTLGDKVIAFELAFERAARDAKHYDSRTKWAERALAAWKGSGATPRPETTVATGAGLLKRAREHIGEEYRNVLVPKDDPKWKGPWDCAEFLSWLVYQEAGILYGCDRGNPSSAEAYTGAWKDDVERLGKKVSVGEAAGTVGGIVLRYPPGPGKMGHIALCDGKGGTIEAKGERFGVVADTVQGRTWHTGILIPGIQYDSGPLIDPRPPQVVYKLGAPNMAKEIVVRIQEALAAKGFLNPGEISGDFGQSTQDAVIAFQKAEGLTVDGEVGPQTAGTLGISLLGISLDKEKPSLPPLLLLILTLLSKERSMTSLTQPGQGIDPAKLLLLTLLQSLLSGKQIDTTELLTALLTGKPIAASVAAPAPSPTPIVQSSPQLSTDSLALLLPLIIERLTGSQFAGTTLAPPATAPDKTTTVPAQEPLTPVNNALGQTIGKPLNGYKTAIGIAGLLATTVLPLFFPQLAPALAVLKTAAGAAAAGGAAEAATQVIAQPIHDLNWGQTIVDVAKPLFAALTGWGVLGKFDKWFSMSRKLLQKVP